MFALLIRSCSEEEKKTETPPQTVIDAGSPAAVSELAFDAGDADAGSAAEADSGVATDGGVVSDAGAADAGAAKKTRRKK